MRVSDKTPGTTTLLIPRVPEKCSNCGAAISGSDVKWTGPTSIMCPYCDTILHVEMEKVS